MSKNFFIPEPYRSDKPFRVRFLPPVQPTHKNHIYIAKNHNVMDDLIEILNDKRYERKDKRIEVKDLLKDNTNLKEVSIFCQSKDKESISFISNWLINLGYRYIEENQLNDICTLYTQININIEKECFFYAANLNNPRRDDRHIKYDYILSDDMISYIKLIDF